MAILLIIAFAATYRLHREATIKEKSIFIDAIAAEDEKIKQRMPIQQDVKNEASSHELVPDAIKEDSATNQTISDTEASRMIREVKVFVKIEEEYARLRRLETSEEEREKIRRLEGLLGFIMSDLREIAMNRDKQDLLEVFRRIVDYRDGELRLPLAGEYGELRRLIRQPALTNDDRERIKQIVHEMNESAKTNIPTSAFQMPKGE